MNYQLFSGFSTEQLAASKSFITEIIDLNYKQTVLDSTKKEEYDNLKYILASLNSVTTQRQPVFLNIA